MSHLVTIFEQHSYLILSLGIILELLALPISAQFLMSYAGYFVYQGKMNYILALLTSFISACAGITVTYWIGRAGGYRLVDKYGKYLHIGPERYNKIAGWFERSGSKLLVFAYFIAGLRHFSGYVSGISRIPFIKFIIPAYTGAFLWSICFITLGTILGPQWKNFHQPKYLLVFFIIHAFLIAAYFVYRYYKIQTKDFFIRLGKRLKERIKNLRATELFLIFFTLVVIGLIMLMFGLAQD